jgi:hypothetical protein
MGSAELKYGMDGRVAWDQMWASFCDLALAGGPPHRGTLLEPAPAEEIAVNEKNYAETIEEIVRGVSMVTGLPAKESSLPGWIEVQCSSPGMAGWLARAIVMENVLARHERETLYLPAGPNFRLVKEIKNVVTVIAKTCHYWMDHTPLEQQRSIGAMFSKAAAATSLLEPASRSEVRSNPNIYWNVVDEVVRGIDQRLRLPCFAHRYIGWIGVECGNVRMAIWLTRAMIVQDVLARREREVIFLPVGPTFIEEGRCDRLIETFARMHRLARVKKIH